MTTPPPDMEPSRLRASAFIRRAEERVRRSWFRSLTRWVDRTRSDVLPPDGGPVQAQQVGQNRGFWGELMQSETIPEVSGIYAQVRNRILDRDEPVTDPESAAYLNEVGNRLVRVPDEVYALIVREIEQGIAAGESIPDIRDRVQTVLTATATPYWKNRAVTVARTECLPGSTVVHGALATAVYRRWYEGQWVEIVTASGRKIAGTPNHPVLTQRGWVGLGQLTEADHLICDSTGIECSGATTDEDVRDAPPTLAEVFNATAAVVVPERKATAQPDFHGDGRDGYVDVLTAYGVLRLGAFTPVTESRCEGVLPPTDLPQILVAAACAPFARGVPVDQQSRLSGGTDFTPRVPYTSTDCFNAAPELGSQIRRRFTCGISSCDWIDREIPSKGTVSRAQQIGAGCAEAAHDACPSDCGPDRVSTETGGVCDGSIAESGRVEMDRVARVVFTEWSGHVYNLTTVDGYFSVNAGVYTGNTMAAVNAGAYNGAVRDAAERGDPAPFKVWLSTEDQRTRPTHVEADGQRTLLSSPFRVGGAQLLFPGDPRGPAQEIINCRCSLLPVVLGDVLDWTNRQDP